MAAAKFMIMLVLLAMGGCVPAPEPDPHNDIVVQVQQEVNTGCCNGVCPCKDRRDICRFGRRLTLGCVDLLCLFGKWHVLRFNPDCGSCGFGGEPLVYTFDNLRNTIPDPPDLPPGTNPEINLNLISVNLDGEFVMTQPGPDHGQGGGTADFGVNGHFTKEATWDGSLCGTFTSKGEYTPCINGLIYYQDNVAIKLQLKAGIIEVYWYDTYLKWGDSNWIRDTASTLIPLGRGISVYDGLSSIPRAGQGRGTDCAIVIGSKGILVTLCKQAPWFTKGYPWSYIYAMPSLQYTAATYPPTKTTLSTGLYGLCNAWTNGHNQINFWNEDGSEEDDWQCGLSTDHDTTTRDIRVLCNSIAGTWMRP